MKGEKMDTVFQKKVIDNQKEIIELLKKIQDSIQLPIVDDITQKNIPTDSWRSDSNIDYVDLIIKNGQHDTNPPKDEDSPKNSLSKSMKKRLKAQQV